MSDFMRLSFLILHVFPYFICSLILSVILYPIGHSLFSSVILYPIGHSLFSSVILYPIVHSLFSSVILYPIGHSLFSSVIFYLIGHSLFLSVIPYFYLSFPIFICHSCEGRNPVSGFVLFTNQSHWAPACAGATYLNFFVLLPQRCCASICHFSGTA